MGGIYVHIPFCTSFCIYCGFYSVKYNGSCAARFTDALRREIVNRSGFFNVTGAVPCTLYFGGGTPSVLPVKEFAEIVGCIRDSFGNEIFREFTIEVNPDDIVCAKGNVLASDAVKLSEYRRLGVNRVSIGIQSFCDENLRWMNRRHSASQAIEAFRQLRSQGFDNISIDLIFGYGGLSRLQWEHSIYTALDLAPEHISCYQLSIEEGSRLAYFLSENRYVPLSDEECAWQYERLQNLLSGAGYLQYEISNFCKPGYESIHNTGYWNRTPYIGLGPAAHSFDGKRTRKWNVNDLEEYCAGESGGCEELSPKEIFNEVLMLGLRKTEGLSFDSIAECCPTAPLFLKEIEPVMRNEISSGNLILEKGILRIPSDRLFVSDGIIESLMEV